MLQSFRSGLTFSNALMTLNDRNRADIIYTGMLTFKGI